MLARHEYGLLAPEVPVGDPAAVYPKECGDGHEATMKTGGPDVRETETGDRNGQHTLLTCGHPEESDMESGPPERKRVINMCGHHGGGGGVAHPAACASRAQPGE